FGSTPVPSFPPGDERKSPSVASESDDSNGDIGSNGFLFAANARMNGQSNGDIGQRRQQLPEPFVSSTGYYGNGNSSPSASGYYPNVNSGISPPANGAVFLPVGKSGPAGHRRGSRSGF
ncbi:hypothetical protein HDU76_008734, partial [Blyttiomyces sp. JEL0837]